MKKQSIFLSIFLVFSLVLVFGGNVPHREAFPEKSPGQFDPMSYLKSQQEKFDWLMAEASPIPEKLFISVRVTEQEMQAVESYKCEDCGKDAQVMRKKVRIGLTKPVELTMSGTSPYSSTNDGGRVWSAALESNTATALRVHFTDVNLPGNAALYIYNAGGEAFGPYTGRGPGDKGDFWSHTVSGPIAFVQLRFFGNPAPGELEGDFFKIKDIGHIGPKFLLPFLQKSPTDRGKISTPLALCSYNEPCVEDASCFSGTAINDAKYAVAHMEWISGSWIYYCTGGLIADTVASSQIPYFLTANHCISKSRAASGLECYWQYWTASCGGDCYDPVGVVPRTLGADIVSTNKTGDYTLMQLREDPPPGSVFMGWTSAPVAFSDGTELFRISHPAGAPQAYSKHRVDVNSVTCSGWPRGDWIYSRDIVGATEGGSSGSPVYNLSGQIVGQLTGACGYNVNDPCDSESNATVDGAFATYFTSVQPWLDPQTTGGEMHVEAIALRTEVKAVFTTAFADVTILDEFGAPVANATVSGTFTGDIAGNDSAVTDANGVATLSIKQKVSVTNFTFCVDNVTHASFTYNESANVVTCVDY